MKPSTGRRPKDDAATPNSATVTAVVRVVPEQVKFEKRLLSVQMLEQNLVAKGSTLPPAGNPVPSPPPVLPER